VVDTKTHYRFPDGSLATVTVSEGIAYDVPDGTVAVDEMQFAPLLAAAEAARAAHVADLEEADRDRGRQVYGALTGAGIPPLAAGLLSGYTPAGHGD
jgi:hypothetical protein